MIEECTSALQSPGEIAAPPYGIQGRSVVQEPSPWQGEGRGKCEQVDLLRCQDHVQEAEGWHAEVFGERQEGSGVKPQSLGIMYLDHAGNNGAQAL